MRTAGTALLMGAFLAAGVVGTAAASGKSRHHSAAGTIQAWDGSTHTLTLKTSKDSPAFKVNDATQIWIGAQTGGTDDLAGQQGAKATVKYSVSAGEKVASMVRIAVPPGTHK